MRCQSHLDELVLIGDRLLLAAPQIPPPADFEDKAVALMAAPAPVAPDGPSSWIRRRAVLVAAAALAVAGLSVAGYAVSNQESPSPGLTALGAGRVGTILRADGTIAGTITLSSQPRPLALVTVDHPRGGTGVVTCELVDAHGQATTIGSWSADQIARGAWAVGIDPALLSSQRMNLRSPEGAIVASAALR